MDILIISSLIIAGLILFIIEVFLLPGISIAGFVSAGCLLYANYYAFDTLGTVPGCITLAISVIGVVAINAESGHLHRLVIHHDRDCAVLQTGLNHMEAPEDAQHFLRQHCRTCRKIIYSGHIVTLLSQKCSCCKDKCS